MTHVVDVPSGVQVRYNLRGRKYDSKCFPGLPEAEEFLNSLPMESHARQMQSNNTSGMVGIRVRWAEYSGGEPYPELVVNYVMDGKTRITSMSLNKHGVEGALTLALKLRGEEDRLQEYIPIVRGLLK